MSTRNSTRTRPQRRRLAGLALAALITLAPAADAAADIPSRQVGPAEKPVAMDRILEEANPLPVPQTAGLPAAAIAAERPSGPRIAVRGTAPRSARSGAMKRKSKRARRARKRGRLVQNGPWGGTFNTNPNLQIGKLYFDVQPGPGVRWSHCSATAVNSENRSLVMTAGHCVYDPSTGAWSEDLRFCPGYERGCGLGVWRARHIFTTPGWYRSGSWADDTAVVLVNPNASGNLVDVVGGQGITFNENVGLDRHAFGYPAADSRWPRYRYDGEDLIYCRGRDRYSAGNLIIGCTMTGGSSGGPWLSGFDSTGLGYLNGVNSHKPGPRPQSGKVVASPYFGNAENILFQTARAR
jgi:V8-like Glu-specific endopeptidase